MIAYLDGSVKELEMEFPVAVREGRPWLYVASAAGQVYLVLNAGKDKWVFGKATVLSLMEFFEGRTDLKTALTRVDRKVSFHVFEPSMGENVHCEPFLEDLDEKDFPPETGRLKYDGLEGRQETEEKLKDLYLRKFFGRSIY
ncbi:MAG: hypothetical protein J6Y62_02065 [Clostridia bacterium]|nr:hypothetical protein [Clostridia bacterium]